MLRTAFFVALLAIAVSPAFGQFTVGVGGGVNRISVSGDAPDNASWAAKLSSFFQLHTELDVASDVSITFQPGIQNRATVLQHTISTGNPLSPADTTVDSAYINTSYFSLPVGIRIYSEKHTWFFSTGAALHLLQSIEIDTLSGTYEPENVIQDFDASLFVGFGYRIPLDPFAISIGAQYQQGIVDLISDDQENTFRDSPVIRMSGFSLGVSFEWRVLP